jgi:hypothetical protein
MRTIERLLGILLLFTCAALAQDKPSASLDFAVMDKGRLLRGGGSLWMIVLRISETESVCRSNS